MTLATVSPGFAAPPPAFFLTRPLAELLARRPPAVDQGQPLTSVNRWPWHAIRVAPHREFDVDERLVTLGFDVYCPRYWLTWSVRRRRRELLVPYLATWVFARWDAADPYQWHLVNDVPGVASFIGGENPSPILDVEITRLRVKIGEDGRLIEAEPALTPFAVGNVVRLLQGPCEGYVGTVLGLRSNDRIAQVKIGDGHRGTMMIICSASWCEPVPADPWG